MKRFLTAAALLAATTAPAFAGYDVSVGMGDSGYYGRIEIGNYPAPVVVNTQPVIVQPPRVVYEPIYVRVPEGHRKHWAKHCAAYGACGRPVYFVQDRWYHDVYRPRYAREHHRDWDRRDRNDGRWDRDDHRHR